MWVLFLLCWLPPLPGPTASILRPDPPTLAWEADLWVRNLRALLMASCLPKVSERALRQGGGSGVSSRRSGCWHWASSRALATSQPPSGMRCPCAQGLGFCVGVKTCPAETLVQLWPLVAEWMSPCTEVPRAEPLPSPGSAGKERVEGTHGLSKKDTPNAPQTRAALGVLKVINELPAASSYD